MTEKTTGETPKHALTLTARNRAEISGVTEVESFDEHSVILVTDCGEMTVEGEDLRVGALDIARGVIEVTGTVGGVYYRDAAPARRGLRSRLFR